MKIVDSANMSRIDSLAQSEYGIPGGILMENAGIKAYGVCRELIEEFSDPHIPLLFVAGSGNNGGDALVMARQAFLDNLNVAVLLAGPVKSDAAAANLNIAQKLKIPVVSLCDEPEKARELLHSRPVVVDGLFGTGVSGPLRQGPAELVEEINSLNATVVSIDLPSGLGDEFRQDFPLVHADYTLCLGLPKRCLYLPHARKHCGRIVHIRIGFPAPLVGDPGIPGELLDYWEIERLIRPIPIDAHKGTRGRLAVFAGDIGTTGAPVLASESAARSRCGLVYLFAEQTAYLAVASKVVSVMAKRWNCSDDPSGFDTRMYDAYLAGPGWGFEGRLPWLEMLMRSGLKGVLDADALTLLSTRREAADLQGKAVLTPHPGEIARLLDTGIEDIQNDPVGAAQQAASMYNAITVLKGHVTTICDPAGKFRLFDGSNPVLGTGGSGDVLAGIIAGLLSGGYEATEAACLGVLVHAKAARMTYEERGWFLAEDIPPYISKVFAEYDG